MDRQNMAVNSDEQGWTDPKDYLAMNGTLLSS